MDVLCSNVGVIEAEKFIYLIRGEDFDYTKWQREHYDSMAPDQLKQELDSRGRLPIEYAADRPLLLKSYEKSPSIRRGSSLLC